MFLCVCPFAERFCLNVTNEAHVMSMFIGWYDDDVISSGFCSNWIMFIHFCLIENLRGFRNRSWLYCGSIHMFHWRESCVWCHLMFGSWWRCSGFALSHLDSLKLMWDQCSGLMCWLFAQRLVLFPQVCVWFWSACHSISRPHARSAHFITEI